MELDMSFVIGIEDDILDELGNSQGLSGDEAFALRAHRCKIHLSKSGIVCGGKR